MDYKVKFITAFPIHGAAPLDLTWIMLFNTGAFSPSVLNHFCQSFARLGRNSDDSFSRKNTPSASTVAFVPSLQIYGMLSYILIKPDQTNSKQSGLTPSASIRTKKMRKLH